jgi:hypothetical protein
MSDDLGRRSRRHDQCPLRRTGQGAWTTETGAKRDGRSWPIAGRWPDIGTWQPSKLNIKPTVPIFVPKPIITAAAEVCHQLGRQFLRPLLCWQAADPLDHASLHVPGQRLQHLGDVKRRHETFGAMSPSLVSRDQLARRGSVLNPRPTFGAGSRSPFPASGTRHPSLCRPGLAPGRRGAHAGRPAGSGSAASRRRPVARRA